MKRLLILATLAMPIAAHAQQAATVEDKVAASEATNADLLNLVTNLRAQILADQRERKDILQKLLEAEKKVAEAKPVTPNNAPAPVVGK